MNESTISSHHKAPNTPKRDAFLIAGLGASAGGIQALQEFFEHVPADSGVAYVVILHLLPDHDSRLAEVLQMVATIPVSQVREKTRVEPNHVYVVPPNQHLEMQDGYIIVSPNTQIEERRAPVDIFFRTLADSHGEAAVAVILSGTGANGSMGIKRIKERGGVAFVQNPREAEFNEMPRNSIATELVDDILPVAEIPARIIAYKNSLGKIAIPIEDEQRPADQQKALREIFTQLRVRTGHDFTNYKRPTLLRRIERRINVRNLPSLSAYTAFLQQSPDEAQALLKDVLISVTNFFRDKTAFEALEHDILPSIFKGKKNGDQVRIWVAGCATGEEAYSVAMLCAERMQGMIDAPKVQIFATDIDEAAIAAAREGLYTLNDAADVSPERLRRFFTKEGDEYRIRREIRETVLFAIHNVIKDPPFSHLDLVTCRNLFIYLNHTAKKRVLETLHFALNPGGYLFLGTSEAVDGASDLFAPVLREQHIFQSRQVSARPYPVPDSVPAFRFEPTQQKSNKPEGGAADFGRLSYGDLHQRLLEQYAPPSVLVNEEYDVVHLTARAGQYLEIKGGELTKNLLALVRQELRLELRAALYKAVQQRTNVEAPNLKVRIDDRLETVNLHIRPILQEGDTARGFLLVLFEQSSDREKDEEVIIASDEPISRQLEEELINVKGQLRATNELHELQAEELKASNEELQAMNEELRSTAEELETSKEELQSINEELRTVNQELKIKVEEVTLTSNNLQNLINSTDIATIFLDRNFRVQLFSPTARDIFNLIPADFGRPLSDITHRLNYADLQRDAELVLDKLNPVERELQTSDGRVFTMRVLPYRTAEDRINGVVVTFFDITRRKQAEDAVLIDLQETRLLRDIGLRFNIEGNIQVLYDEIMEAAISIMQADAGTMQMLDPHKRELVLIAQRGFDQTMTEKFARVDARSGTTCGIALLTGERAFVNFAAPGNLDTDGSFKAHLDAGYITAQSTPLIARSGKAIGMISTHWRKHYKPSERELRFLDLLVRQTADLIEQRQAAEALRESEERLRLMMESITDYAIILTDLEGRIEQWNPGAEHLFGWTAKEVVGQPCDFIFTAEDRAAGAPERERQQAREHGRAADERWHVRKDGSRFYVSGVMAAFLGSRFAGFGKIARDLTEWQKTEEELRRSREELEAAVQLRTQELSTAYESLIHEVQERRTAEERVKELLRQLIGVQEDERRHLSRELHDGLGQQLTALRIGLEALQKLSGEQAHEQMASLQQTLQRLDTEVDFMAWELRPASLDEFGLVSALATYVAEWSKQFRIVADFHAKSPAEERKSYEIETTLYRIAQEALNNIAKHAQATHVAVILEHRDGQAVLIVEDNGIGFKQERESSPLLLEKGLGLLGIRERAALLGGTAEIESSQGTGTTVFVRLPLLLREE
jgi:two-component system, chemotaxis family, CheB/CheR fusion protein